MERESATALKIALQVINKEEFEETYFNDSFLAYMMLDKFKKFLDDRSFEDIERQMILRAFLQNNYPITISSEIIDYAQNKSKLSDDYIKVLLEYNYEASDFIKGSHLAEYDGEYLGMTMSQKINFDKSLQEKRKELIDNTMKLIENVKKYNKDEGNGKKED